MLLHLLAFFGLSFSPFERKTQNLVSSLLNHVVGRQRAVHYWGFLFCSDQWITWRLTIFTQLTQRQTNTSCSQLLLLLSWTPVTMLIKGHKPLYQKFGPSSVQRLRLSVLKGIPSSQQKHLSPDMLKVRQDRKIWREAKLSNTTCTHCFTNQRSYYVAS